MSLSFDEVLARASPPTDVVTLCVDGGALGELAVLERKLSEAVPPESLGERSQASVIVEQIAEVKDRMRAAEVDFALQAVHPADWAVFYATLPSKVDDEPDGALEARYFAWCCDLVARTCVDPVMTPEQVTELVGRLHAVAWAQLSDRCWALNTNKVSIPFSVADFVAIPPSGPTSAPQSTTASPTANGSAPKRPRRPRTSTTKKPAA